ncbi:MAG: phosphatase PAP2 family protein [Bacteroidales bacterium]|nr:phosphatase PAP2 family protein [Bacteroidales bacterium]
MTKKFISLVAILAGCAIMSEYPATGRAEDEGKITVVCPEARLYLPGYPPFSDREAFFNDSLLYRRGLAIRDSERGRQAVTDAGADLGFYLSRFGAAMEVDLSESGTPAIAKYLKTTYDFVRTGISTAKDSFARQRPFSYFHESSAIPEEEGLYGEFTSYPSGHALRAWTIVMALVAIDDTHSCEIIKVGMELAESRIITGFHYASDVEDARMAASVGFARIVSDPEFTRLMNRARRELDSLR